MAENEPEDFKWFNQVVQDNPLLTKKEEVKLFKEMENGSKQARERIFLSNILLVKSIAKRYIWAGDINDLMQEGFVGLNRAIEKYEYWQDNKFSTYATWWIRQSVQRYALSKMTVVKFPFYVKLLRRKYKKSLDALVMELGRNPSPEELLKHTKMKPAEFLIAERAMKDEMSINSFVFGTEKSSLNKGNISTPHEEDDLRKKSISVLSEVLLEFDDKERTVIYLRFGIGCVPQTLRQIGVTLGLTRERVRQIEHAVLAELALYPSVRELFHTKD